MKISEPFRPFDGGGDRVVQRPKITSKLISARMDWDNKEGGFGLLLGEGLVIDGFLTPCLEDKLQIGDRIIRVSGIRVHTFNDLEEFIRTRPSSWLNIEVIRGVMSKNGEYPKNEAAMVGARICGVYGRGRTRVMHSVESEC